MDQGTQKLNAWMTANEVNQPELARRVGCRQSVVQRWVAGLRMPSPFYILQIERVTDGAVRLEDWVEGGP